MDLDKEAGYVPNIIHYCWFGGGPLHASAKEAIASWARFAPGCEIKRWDETNFDVRACSFASSAYNASRWAFVSDYARFRILYDYGGIYMDVGSKLIRNIVSLISHVPFSAIERGSKTVSAGLIAACDVSNPITREVVREYEAIDFIDTREFMERHTVNEMFTCVLERHGYVREDRMQHVAGWTIFPSSFFDPKLDRGGYTITENTYSTHKGSASWMTEHEKYRLDVINKWAPVVGDLIARKAARLLMMIRYGRRR